MGNFNIKHKLVRCEKCFSIRKITIEPKFPQTEILLECRCEPKRINLENYISELHKNELYKIKCGECGKEDHKSMYCHNCSHILCTNCFKNHQAKYNSTPHKIIPAIKFEFFCLEHQNELNVSFCRVCEESCCKICVKDPKHKGHLVISFKKIISGKFPKNKLQNDINFIKDKLEYNEKVTSLILKKEKNEAIRKKIKEVSEINLNINKNIFEIIQFILFIFERSKNQSWNIIRNLIRNTHFNLLKLKFQKNTSVDEDSASLIKYFENDFILCARSEKSIKEELPSSLGEDDFSSERTTTMLCSSNNDFMKMLQGINLEELKNSYKNIVNDKKENKNENKEEEQKENNLKLEEKVPISHKKSENFENNIIEEKEVIKETSDINKNEDLTKEEKEKEKEVGNQVDNIKYNKFIEQIWSNNRKKINGRIVERMMIRSKLIS